MKLLTKPYQHQEAAIDKLSRVKVGALYMEMGTGKTRTGLGLGKKRLEENKIDRFLWLCPCSVKTNLKKDIIKHTGEFDPNLFRISGIETLSTSTSENLALVDYVKRYRVNLLVDESIMVKNPNAKRTQNIIRLSEMCRYKQILNGTPIGRNEADLFSQWKVLDWRIFGYRSYWGFAQNHIEYDEQIPGKINRVLNVDYLTRKMEPYTYQALKDDCLDLPPKTYQMMWYDLTDKQLQHYQEVADALLFRLDELRPETIYRLFSGLQCIISGLSVDTSGRTLVTRPFFEDPLANPRLEALLYVLHSIGDKKVIIYVKYLHEIDTVIKKLEQEFGKECAVPYSGEISNRIRDKKMEQFEKDAQYLVATKGCAAFGHNLQFCSYIVNYNHDFDYVTRAQSEDRVHRVGQVNNVHIIDIGADNTLDERVLSCLGRKERLVDTFRASFKSLSKEACREWLSRGDQYGKAI